MSLINTISQGTGGQNSIFLDKDYIEGTLEHVDVPLPTDTSEYALSAGAFYNLPELKSVFIPSSLCSKLTKKAFSKNTKLEKIVLQCDESTVTKKTWYKNKPWGAPSTCQLVWDVEAKPIVKQNTPQPLVLPTTTSTPEPSNYRYAMRELLRKMRKYVNTINYPDFQFINNGGVAIFSENEDHDWLEKNIAPIYKYVNAVVIEDVFYGYDVNGPDDDAGYGDDKPTTPSATADFLEHIANAQSHGMQCMVLDYCSTPANIQDSFAKSAAHNMVDYCADTRELIKLTDYPVQNENSDDHYTLKTIKNYAILLNSGGFESQEAYLSTLADTNYDCLIIDLLGPEHPLTPAEVERIHYKKNGGRRLIISYMSLGEAETYRTYWNPDWSNYHESENENEAAAKKENAANWKKAVSNCQWIDGPNGAWIGNFKVKYWTDEWQKVLFGTKDSYIDILTKYGFDGAFLDVIDAYEYFEEKAEG